MCDDADDSGIENFAEQPFYSDAIKKESKIYSATGDGKVPFVSADDIAAAAVSALTNPDPPNTEYLVLGPELLSYRDVGDLSGTTHTGSHADAFF